MSKPAELPEDYTPYQQLIVCSNQLHNAQMILEIAGHAPLLVGSGATPRLWLSVPTSKEGKEWASIVRDSKALHPKVEVTQEPDGSTVVVAAGKRILKVRARDANSAEIPELDLRPLGFDVHGDERALWVGSNEFSANSVYNVRAMIAIGP
jgi:hypothetical protein